MADIERKNAPEPEVDPFTGQMNRRRGDVYAQSHNGAVRGTRDQEVFNDAVSHLNGGVKRTNTYNTFQNRNNNLI